MTPEEAAEAMHSMLRLHYEAFLTSKLGELGNRSLMEVCKTKAGKNKAVEVLKDVENNQRRLERDNAITVPMDMTWMWEKLGVVRESA